jgi:hypothetical protein
MHVHMKIHSAQKGTKIEPNKGVRHVTSHHATPRHIASRHVISRHATSYHATPRHITPRHVPSPEASRWSSAASLGWPAPPAAPTHAGSNETISFHALSCFASLPAGERRSLHGLLKRSVISRWLSAKQSTAATESRAAPAIRGRREGETEGSRSPKSPAMSPTKSGGTGRSCVAASTSQAVHLMTPHHHPTTPMQPNTQELGSAQRNLLPQKQHALPQESARFSKVALLLLR